jgi:hypothetical protein
MTIINQDREQLIKELQELIDDNLYEVPVEEVAEEFINEYLEEIVAVRIKLKMGA